MSAESPASESSMDILKKKVMNSPLGRRKNNGSPGNSNKTFGATLQELNTRNGMPIPFIVKKTVEFIQNHGIGHEGIFRVNGSAKIVEKLKTSFDKTGDANLEDAGDVMAVAGLLKQFLREMADSVIPESMTDQFINVQQEHHNDTNEFDKAMRPLLDELPEDNLTLLKYLTRFLVQVSMKEDTNKMTPMAIGIVFGPNLFRCNPGLEGLKQQGLTNQIVCKFIQNYDELFKDENEQSLFNNKIIQHQRRRKPPNSFVVQEAKSPRTPPARPPPPKFSVDRELTDTPPIPSPRLSKIKYEASLYQDESQGDSRTQSPRSRNSMLSPRLAEDEVLSSRASPFMLDSECGSSCVQSPSPILSMVASELVEKTISAAVSEHLFGDGLMGGLLNWSSDEGRTESPDKNDTPVPAPRRKRKQKSKQGEQETPEEEKKYSSFDDDRPVSVKDRINSFESDTADPTRASDAAVTENTDMNSAVDVFDDVDSKPQTMSSAETSSLAQLERTLPDGVETNDGSDPESPPVPKPRAPRKRSSQNDMDATSGLNLDKAEFDSIEISTPLNVFKRTKGPMNRSPPSRAKMREKSQFNSSQQTSSSTPAGGGKGDVDIESSSKFQDVNHNEEKPSIGFLDIPFDNQDTSGYANPSPNSKKPFVPPLDLTILHQHGDGTDPILADDGPSVFQKGKSLNEEEAVLSPRSHKLRKKTGSDDSGSQSPSVFKFTGSALSANTNTDVAPSPPGGQQVYTPSGAQEEDEHAIAVKNFTKKIQTLKKKIKQFEDQFEEEKGYKPSQSDKNAKPEIKRYVAELNKVRKDLKQLKEQKQTDEHLTETYPGNHPNSASRPTSSKSRPGTAKSSDRPSSGKDRPTSGRSASSDERLENEAPNEPPTMKGTLEQLLKKLNDKRTEAGRPENLNSMTREQVQEEKLAVQKALLHFESLHGRPATKPDKELMRPLYDRYRNVKKLLAAKPASPKDKGDLETVPENHSMSFSQKDKPIQIQEQELGTTDFMVTQNINLLKETTHDNVVDTKQDDSDNDDGDTGDKHVKASGDSHLHALSKRELLDEQYRAKADKKRLRKILREFEDGFHKQHGRKVQKEDRSPMASEYEDYKQVKAKLRLLEALLSKHDGTSTM